MVNFMSNRNKLAAKFRKILPSAAVIAGEDSLKCYESDGLTAHQQLPLLVVLPQNVSQVLAVLQLCRELKLPIVSRGAGTGLSGGATPHAAGIVLGLAKMNRILNIDADNRIATVQPGVCNLAISNAAAKFGLFYAPDPSSQIACTIGGNVAENAGGIHCLKYGLTVHNILRLQIATIGGELLTIGGGLDNPGYDLLALITGSEGMLGVVTEVDVKLLPRPQSVELLMASFDSVMQAADAVAAIIAAGVVPAGVEMMDNMTIRAVEKFAKAGYPTLANALILCELDGELNDVQSQLTTVKRVVNDHQATEINIAADEKQRAKMWSGRKAAFPAIGQLAPDYYCIDGTIPRRAIGKVLGEINQLSTKYKLPVANVFHAGDGNLHPLILYDANKAGQLQKAEQLGSRILELCLAHGGTITGEHGVGLEKIGEMCVQFNEDELAQFHAVRNAFDPDGLLNPGKAIPTLARCAEHNAMHVHRGQLKFAELERL